MIVGLTGGIGSGKSKAAAFFREQGITVVDADQVARDVVEPGTQTLSAIEEHFGPSILDQGCLNRTKLKEIIFNTPSEKVWLEDLLHPVIREEMFRQLKNATSPYAILEAPLLFENGLENYCQRTIVVDIPIGLQVERTKKRDQSSSDLIHSIIESQMSREDRINKADYIVDNSGDLDSLKAQVLRLDQILKLLAQNQDFQ